MAFGVNKLSASLINNSRFLNDKGKAGGPTGEGPSAFGDSWVARCGASIGAGIYSAPVSFPSTGMLPQGASFGAIGEGGCLGPLVAALFRPPITHPRMSSPPHGLHSPDNVAARNAWLSQHKNYPRKDYPMVPGLREDRVSQNVLDRNRETVYQRDDGTTLSVVQQGLNQVGTIHQQELTFSDGTKIFSERALRVDQDVEEAAVRFRSSGPGKVSSSDGKLLASDGTGKGITLDMRHLSYPGTEWKIIHNGYTGPR